MAMKLPGPGYFAAYLGRKKRIPRGAAMVSDQSPQYRLKARLRNSYGSKGRMTP